MQESVHVQQQGSVTYYPVPETQKDTATRQRAMHGGKSVRPEQAVIRSFSQMAVVPDRSQRTTTSCEVVMGSASWRGMETANISQTDIPVTERKCHDEPEQSFQSKVNSAIFKLGKTKEDSNSSDAVSYCIWIAKSCQQLLQSVNGSRKQVDAPANLTFLITKMAPIYDAALKDALRQAQQDLARGENSRVYGKKLDRIARNVDLLLREVPDYQNHRTRLHALLRHCIDNDLIYLEHLKLETSPSEYAVIAAAKSIEFLLGHRSSIHRLSLMSEDEMKTLQDKRDQLLETIFENTNDGTTERKKENRDVPERDVSPEITKMLTKIKQFDELNERFDKAKKGTGGEVPEDIQQCACILKALINMCNYYDQTDQTDQIDTGVFYEIRRYLSAVAKKILLSGICNTEKNPCMSESLELIGGLMQSQHNWFSRECKTAYVRCMQSEADLMSATAETGNITGHYGGETLDIVLNLAMSNTEANWLKAAALLSQITSGDGGAMMPDMQMSSVPSFNIIKVKEVLSTKLFNPVLCEYNFHKKKSMTKQQLSVQMNHRKPRFVKLIPYVFILKDACTRTAWKHAAYCVWHNDIERLRFAETFGKEDVDTLLYLKHLAPMTKDYHQRYRGMIDALENFFWFAQQDPRASAFITETVELSAWTDSLCKSYPIGELKRLNEAWKQKYQSAAGEDLTASGALAEGAMPAATAHPAIADVSMEASGGHLHMEQQFAPPVKFLTDLVDTPVSATQRFPWQSVPAASCVSMTQPPVASEPNPGLQPFTAPYGAPASLPWQSVPAASCAPMIPPSAANSLQSMPAQNCSLNYHETSIGDQPYFPVYTHVQGYYPAVCEHVHPQSYIVPQSQYLFQPITSAECGSGYPQASRGIIEQIDWQMNLLSAACRNLSQMPMHGGEYQQQLPGLYSTTGALDNGNVIEGVLHLLTALKSHRQQKESESYGSISEIPLPTSPESEHYPVFKQGVDALIEGMQQITGNSLNRDVAYELLMQLGSDDGKSAMEQLLTLMKGEAEAKGVAVGQKLGVIRNWLFSVNTLLRSE